MDSEKIPDIIISKIKCKGCSKIFRSNTILKHLRKSTVKNCIDYYNDESLASIKNDSIQLSKTKAEIWKNAHKVEIKQRKANNRAKCPDKTKEREAKYDVEHSEERKLKAAERRKKRKMFNHKIYENFKLHERYHSWTKLCLL